MGTAEGRIRRQRGIAPSTKNTRVGHKEKGTDPESKKASKRGYGELNSEFPLSGIASKSKSAGGGGAVRCGGCDE